MTMTQEQKKTVGVAVAVIIVVALALYFKSMKPANEGVTQNTNIPVNQNTTNTNVSQKGSRSDDDAVVYQRDVTAYQGKLIQFENCQSLLSNYTFKSGTKIMLDGKSPDPQIITVGAKSVTLNGFDYAFVTLESATEPKTIDVDCRTQDQAQYNVAKILIQP
jgi:hypothetical protein